MFVIKSIYAIRLWDEAEKRDAVDALFLQKPWIQNIPAYDMLNGKLFIVVMVAGLVATILLCLLVASQFGRLGRVLALREESR